MTAEEAVAKIREILQAHAAWCNCQPRADTFYTCAKFLADVATVMAQVATK